MILKKVLIAALIALLALSAGAALASRHHHGAGHRARTGHCHPVEGAGGYCHYDGACAHGGDACHFYAEKTATAYATAAACTGRAKTANSAATTAAAAEV